MRETKRIKFNIFYNFLNHNSVIFILPIFAKIVFMIDKAILLGD